MFLSSPEMDKQTVNKQDDNSNILMTKKFQYDTKRWPNK